MTPLILASESPYRRALLEQLAVPFTTEKPLFDEEAAKSHFSGSPQQLAEYLSLGKAQSLADKNNCCIGSDQLVHFQNKILGKAHTPARALQQLTSLAGATHELITSTCVIFRGQVTVFSTITKMKMRTLSADQLQRYIEIDNPIDCAGSYKIEKHGISLFEKIDCEDFTAIQGLPLLQLGTILRTHGYEIPGSLHE